MKNLYKIEDELYIVSLSEKIKENTQSFKEGLNGDWFYNTIYNFIARTGDITPYDFKIILTTNNLLIADGIQAINDEFLEWFVKNPSCEKVEFNAYPIGSNGNIIGTNRPYPFDGLICNFRIEYKIIIPQEEHKTNLERLPFFELVKEFAEYYKKVPLVVEPKQETLEEAAERYLQEWRLLNNIHLSNVIHAERCKNNFIAGAKWQADRMYSESDLREAYIAGKHGGKTQTYYEFQEWFEQHKKK